MATSGTWSFNPRIAECVDEAFERCGIDPAKIDVRQIISAKRSLNLLLRSELSGDQINLWSVTETETTPAEGDSSFTLAAGVIDVLEATTKDSEGNETLMLPISRAEWREIPDKTADGRPDRYWVERALGAKTLNFWPKMGSTSYTLVLNTLYGIEDAGDLHHEADVPDLWYDVVCGGLAKRLALKFAPDRVPLLEAQFMRAHDLAKRSNNERASIIFVPDYGGGRRW